MQLSHAVHSIAAIGFICLGLGHIYLGTIGMQGAYAAMRKGAVAETWAKEPPLDWYRQKKSEGAVPGEPAHGGGAPSRQPAQPRKE